MVKDNASQALADQCAQEHGYFATIYWGKVEGEQVYSPYYKDDVTPDKGSTFVVVKDGKAEFLQNNDRAYNIVHDIINGGGRDIETRGFNAYKRFIEKYQKGKLSPEDAKYAAQLLEVVPLESEDGGKIEVKLDIRIFCFYFEMAERFKKHLAFFPEDGNDDILHIKIVD